MNITTVKAARGAVGATIAALFSACAPAPADMLDAARGAWRQGDASAALESAEARVRSDGDSAREIVVLAAAALGDHARAVEAYRSLSQAGLNPIVDVAAFEALLHLDRPDEALELARRRNLEQSFIHRAETRARKPLRVLGQGVSEIPLHVDALSQYAPGFEALVNGVRMVVRIDTGADFIFLAPPDADAAGVVSDRCVSASFNLEQTTLCFGATDFSVDGFTLKQAPATVIGNLPHGEVLGGEMGPVLGLNALRPFLFTIDPVAQRMTLSRRGDEAARASHFSRLGRVIGRAPFLYLGAGELVIRYGAVGGDALNVLLDTGHYAADSDGRQIALLAPMSRAASWTGRDDLRAGGVEPLNVPIAIGGASVPASAMLVLRDAWWSGFGDFDGIDVGAVAANGFLKNFAWTIDFDAYEIVLTEPGEPPTD